MTENANVKWLTFKADPELASRIEDARTRLLAAAPGVAVSRSSVLRHLLTLGIESSEVNQAPSTTPPS